MLTLQNSHYQLAVNPQALGWSLFGSDLHGPSLEEIQIAVTYRAGSKVYRLPQPGQPLLAGGVQTVESIHGPAQTLTLKSPADANGLRITLTFALPANQPLMLWKMQVDHRGGMPVQVDRIEMLKAGFVYKPKVTPTSVLFGIRETRKFPRGSVRPHSNPGKLAFFSNGWQSWSYTGMLGPHMRYPRSRLGALRRPVETGFGTLQPTRRGHFASDMFGILVDRRYRTGILAGFLSQKQQFGSLEAIIDPLSPALVMWANGDGARLDPGASLETDWACIQFVQLDDADPFGAYLDAAARENGSRLGDGKVYEGWCSWYHYYTRLTAGDIRHNLETIRRQSDLAPLDLVQIDDGFETQVGDWSSFKPSFPGGVEALAGEIQAGGQTPGLWLAPFIALPGSKVVREHPGWILRGAGGLPVNTGFLWETFPRALDLTVPEALEYAAGVCRTAAKEWGFPYLKLDFLFAAALPGRFHDATRTRAQVLRSGLEAIRAAVGADTYLVGCGCPLGPAIGLVDAMRIGTDVEQTWEPSHLNISLPFRGEPAIPSAKSAIRNALTRAHLHRRWWVNDPDCLLLRPSTQLSETEVRSLAAVIALTGGSLVVSDDLSQVPPDRLELLAALLPVIGKTPRLPGFFDEPVPSKLRLDQQGPAGPWSVLALFNWQDRPAALQLRLADFDLEPGQACFARSFWDGSLVRLQAEQTFDLVPAHGSVVLAVRPELPGLPQYLGSSLHISQGLEVSAWEVHPHGLNFRLQRPAKAAGWVDIHLPGQPVAITRDGQPVSWQAAAPGIYRLRVEFEQQTTVNILYP